MEIKPVFLPMKIGNSAWPDKKTEEKGASSFSDMLGQAIKDLESMQTQADQLNQRLVSGDLENVHEAVIAMEKANITLQMALLFRNKVIESYQEIMRISV